MGMQEQVRGSCRRGGRGRGRWEPPTRLLSWLGVSCSTLTPFTSSSRAPGGTPARSAAPPGLSTSQKER